MRTLCSILRSAGLLISLMCASGSAAGAAPAAIQARVFDDRILLAFESPMLTWSGNVDGAVVSIDPPVDCRWSWDSDTQLACALVEPAASLPKATAYSLRISGGLWSQEGVEVAPTVIRAESVRPELTANVAGWQSGMPLIDVETNMAVSAASLRSVLRLTLDDGTALAVDLRVLSGERAAWRSGPTLPPTWRIVMPAGLSDRVMSLSVVPGLAASQGALLGVQDTLLSKARINERFRVRRMWCLQQPGGSAEAKEDASPAGIECPAGTGVGVNFSRALDPRSVDWFKHNLPSGLVLQDRVTDLARSQPTLAGISQVGGETVRLKLTEARARVKFELPATLAAADGATLGTSMSYALQTGDFPSSINLIQHRSLLATGERPSEVFETVNTPVLHIAQKELGAGEIRVTQAERHLRGRNRPTRVEAPAPSPDVVAHGGLVQGTESMNLYSGYEIAYASFNVTAARAGNQITVWVTDWNGAHPMQGVAVEVLLPPPVRDASQPVAATAGALATLGTGVTGADGVAIVDISSLGDIDRFAMLLVRASSGSARSIVPLSEPLDDRRSFSAAPEWPRSSQEGDLVLWGVTDRPLYRTGDTVHYRAWIRRRESNHLRSLAVPKAVDLDLVASRDDSVLRSWAAQPDAFGSISGTLALPQRVNDDDYCLKSKRHHHYPAIACFRVAGYHVNDLWADVAADRTFAREGDTLHIDASAGYYSGGPAAGARIGMQSLLTPLRIEDTYPDFSAFAFVDTYAGAGESGESFASSPTSAGTDELGHAQVAMDLSRPLQWPLDYRPIPFGQLELSASAQAGGAMWAASAPATIRFSRHRRFVGLKVSPWLLTPDVDPRVEAVVITDEGTPVPAADVHVVIEEAPETVQGLAVGATPAKAPLPLAQCDVKAGGAEIPCAFRPTHPGRYVFRATSTDAAGTEVERYASTTPLTLTKERPPIPQAQLTAERSLNNAGSTAEILLQQPFRRARVLFVVSHGQVLHHWVQEIDESVTRIPLELPAEWAPGVTLTATLLDEDANPLREKDPHSPIDVVSLDLKIVAKNASPLLELHPDVTTAKPGDEIALTLKNVSDRRLQVTLLVVDDALRALVPDYAAGVDPRGRNWLGQLASWSTPAWYGLASWTRPAHHGYADFFASTGFRQPDNEQLETITVTGSNITAASIFMRGGRHETGLRLASGHDGPRVARMRSEFRETALWNPDIELGPGTAETVRVHLPDNLTRWHVFAWSNDARERFDLAEATLTASLPVEVRAEIPARLFAGDRSAVSMSTRNHEDASMSVVTEMVADGVGVAQRATKTAVLAANAEQTVAVTVAPTTTGVLDVRSTAAAGTARDGIATSVEVASSVSREHEAQTGWLDAGGVSLKLPALPAGAMKPTLHVRVDRGMTGLDRAWIRYLRDYPHRCWEQILSRAIGAAIAKRIGLDRTDWPDAEVAVKEAIDNIAVFQDSSGAFRYFTGGVGQNAWPPSPLLTAYTVRGLSLLKELGYEVPADVEARARKSLSEAPTQVQLPASGAVDRNRLDEAAAIAAVATAPDANTFVLDQLWERRDSMSWFGRAQLARALAARPDRAKQSETAFAQLRGAGEVRGRQRVIVDGSDRTAILGSNARDQCAVLDALATATDSEANREAKRMLARGLVDLYAGGAPSIDTQSAAVCLIAVLHAIAPGPASRAPAVVSIRLGGKASAMTVDAAEGGEWTSTLDAAPSVLELATPDAGADIPSFVADIDYAIDQRRSRPGSVGMELRRAYAVLLDGEWREVAVASIRQGDWVRVSMTLTVPGLRHFVAITDAVPGGLRPADLSLAGVSDTRLRSLADPGSGWFGARQVDDRAARFYAQTVPRGKHVVVYYARAAVAGNFFGPPATAELMYGPASSARTEPFVLSILPAAASPAEALLAHRKRRSAM